MPFAESSLAADPDHRPRRTTTHGVLVQRARETPDAIALTWPGGAGAAGRSWTYDQLRDDAARLALALASRFEPGERIAVWAPGGPEWTIMLFAASFAGLVLVTVDTAFQARELDFVLEQSEAVGLFLVESHRGNPLARIGAEAAARRPALREVVDMADTVRLLAKARIVEGLPEVKPGDPAQLQYTAGTTGFPKRVMLRHRDIANGARLAMIMAGTELCAAA